MSLLCLDLSWRSLFILLAIVFKHSNWYFIRSYSRITMETDTQPEYLMTLKDGRHLVRNQNSTRISIWCGRGLDACVCYRDYGALLHLHCREISPSKRNHQAVDHTVNLHIWLPLEKQFPFHQRTKGKQISAILWDKAILHKRNAMRLNISCLSLCVVG